MKKYKMQLPHFDNIEKSIKLLCVCARATEVKRGCGVGLLPRTENTDLNTESNNFVFMCVWREKRDAIDTDPCVHCW